MLIAGLTVGGLVATSPSASAVGIDRTGGSDRVDTALKAFDTNRDLFTSDTVVLTRSDHFADALTATPLAAALRAPILTTASTTLDERVVAALTRHRIARVVIVGGEGAVSPAVESALRAHGVTTRRIGGADRFETALRVASSVMEARGTTNTQVYLATGTQFPDALSAGSAAAATNGVVLLSRDEVVDDATRAFLTSRATKLTAVGGSAARAGATLGVAVDNVVGADRYATATALARRVFTSPKRAVVASGETFADALSAGPFAGLARGPLLLTAASSLTPGTGDYLTNAKIGCAIVVGGPAAVAERVTTDIQALVTSTGAASCAHGGGASTGHTGDSSSGSVTGAPSTGVTAPSGGATGTTGGNSPTTDSRGAPVGGERSPEQTGTVSRPPAPECTSLFSDTDFALAPNVTYRGPVETQGGVIEYSQPISYKAPQQSTVSLDVFVLNSGRAVAETLTAEVQKWDKPNPEWIYATYDAETRRVTVILTSHEAHSDGYTVALRDGCGDVRVTSNRASGSGTRHPVGHSGQGLQPSNPDKYVTSVSPLPPSVLSH